MKRNKKRLVVYMVFIFLITIFSIKNTKVYAINSNSYSYTWKNDILISGSNKIEKTFYIPENMNCNNFMISLKIKQSPTLIKDLSSVSISINNTKIYSIMLNQINNDGIVTVKVPDNLIYKGTNSIVIKGFLKSTNEKCEINDDVNWIIVEKNSSFNFNYTRSDSTDISDIFDNTYYSDGENGEVNVVLPDNLTDINYSQTASISALIGFVHKNKETNVSIKNLKYSQLNTMSKEAIVMGTVEQIKALNKDLLTNDEWINAEKNGYITIRKIGSKNHYIIITSTKQQVETLCKILKNKSLLSQIKEKYYTLDESIIFDENKFNTNISLNELGYEDSFQQGNGVKEFNYYFTIPAKKTLTENNVLTFSYTYSSLVDYDNGYVTVAINGENLMSKDIIKNKVQDIIEVTIPKKYFDYTAFNISLKFNLKPTVEKCNAQSYDNIWVKVDSINSNLKLELEDREKYSLLNSQGLLQDLNGNVNTNILVDSYKNLSLDSISKIALYLGKVSQGVNKLFISQLEEEYTSSGAIFSLTTSPLIKKINDNIRISISDEGKFVNNELFIQNTNSLGAIELTLNGDKLVILANDIEELNNTIQKYSEVITSKDTVILKNGEIINSFGEAKELENNKMQLIKVNYDIIAALIVLLFSSTSIFIIYYKKVK